MELVKEQEMLPDFRLESAGGGMLGPQDYKEKKNLVVVFFDPACAPCGNFLSDVAARYDNYRDTNTEILAIGEGSLDEVRDATSGRQLPFPVLADSDGHVLRKYSDSTPAVFVADRFGEVRLVRSAEEGKHFPDQPTILSRLELIEFECPECGVPTWTA